MRKPSAIGLEAAREITHYRETDRDVVRLKRWERNILTKERNRIARIVDAAIKTVKETP